MALIDDLVTEIREEVVASMEKPKTYTVESDLYEMLIPLFVKLERDMDWFLDRIKEKSYIFTDGRTREFRAVNGAMYNCNEVRQRLAELKEAVRDPQELIKTLNEKAANKYLEEVKAASREYVDSKLLAALQEQDLF